MNALLELMQKGGPVMFPIVALALLLYGRCFNLLFFVVQTRRSLRETSAFELGALRRLRDQLEETYSRDSRVIGTLISAAPLLGLLGTVTGMIATFDSLAGRRQRSMEGLAEGISQALITTETGLAVAIPAVLMVYYAHRQLQKAEQNLAQIEGAILEFN